MKKVNIFAQTRQVCCAIEMSWQQTRAKYNHKYETDTGNNCRKNRILNIHCIKSSDRKSIKIQNFRDSCGGHTGNCCRTRLYTKHFSAKSAQRKNGNNRARGTGYVESLFCGNLKCHRCRSEETRVHDNSHRHDGE